MLIVDLLSISRHIFVKKKFKISSAAVVIGARKVKMNSILVQVYYRTKNEKCIPLCFKLSVFQKV